MTPKQEAWIKSIKDRSNQTYHEIWTDGSCGYYAAGLGGAAAVVVEKNGNENIVQTATENTTNNRMEMTAAIIGLQSIKDPSVCIVYSDSMYLINTMTRWRLNRHLNFNEEAKNMDLFTELDKECRRHLDVVWVWVKSHSGDRLNNKADMLARRASETEFKRIKNLELLGLRPKKILNEPQFNRGVNLNKSNQKKKNKAKEKIT